MLNVDSEQLQAKDRLQELQAERVRLREQHEHACGELRRRIEELENQRAAAKQDLHKVQGGVDHTEARLLEGDIARTDVLHYELRVQLAKLEGNSFILGTGSRRELAEKVKNVEAALKTKSKEHEGVFAQYVRAHTDRDKLTSERHDVEGQCQELRSRHERLRLDLEAQDIHAHQAWREMDRILIRVRAEKAEVQREVDQARAQAHLDDAARSAVRDEEQEQLATLRRQVQEAQLEGQKWADIAAQRLSTLKDLQQRLAIIAPSARPQKTNIETGSSAGYSHLSDLDSMENSLDIFVAEGEIEIAALLRSRGLSNVEESELRTTIRLSLYGFQAADTEMASGLNPRYDSMVSFGPFMLSDALFEQFSNGALGLELRVAGDIDEPDEVIGRGRVLLGGLLQSSSAKRNAVRSTSAQLFDISSPGFRLARVQVKLHFRYSIEDAAEDFVKRRDLESELLPDLNEVPVPL